MYSFSTQDTIGDYMKDNQKVSKSKDMAPYLRAKIKTMQCDYEKLQHEFRKKVGFLHIYIYIEIDNAVLQCDEVKKLQKDVQVLSDEKEKWLHLHNTNKTIAHKLENQVKKGLIFLLKVDCVTFLVRRCLKRKFIFV